MKNVLLKLPKIENPLSVLVFREYEPNAYSMGEGALIINNYLLDFLDNEDQLIFIMCHELAHENLKHSITSIKKYFQREKSSELKAKTKKLQQQKYNNNKAVEDLLSSLIYSDSKEERGKSKRNRSRFFRICILSQIGKKLKTIYKIP